MSIINGVPVYSHNIRLNQARPMFVGSVTKNIRPSSIIYRILGVDSTTGEILSPIICDENTANLYTQELNLEMIIIRHLLDKSP